MFSLGIHIIDPVFILDVSWAGMCIESSIRQALTEHTVVQLSTWPVNRYCRLEKKGLFLLNHMNTRFAFGSFFVLVLIISILTQLCFIVCMVKCCLVCIYCPISIGWCETAASAAVFGTMLSSGFAFNWFPIDLKWLMFVSEATNGLAPLFNSPLNSLQCFNTGGADV